MLAIIPAVLIIGLRGDSSVTDLVNLSQVVLALQLPFAMFPLLHFTSSRKRMGAWKNGWFLLMAGWASAILITAMDVWALPDSVKSSLASHHRQMRGELWIADCGLRICRMVIESPRLLSVPCSHFARYWLARVNRKKGSSPRKSDTWSSCFK